MLLLSCKLTPPSSPFVNQSLLMKRLAPCCVLPWKTAPCQEVTAPTASSKTTMDVFSASVSAVSSLSSHTCWTSRVKVSGTDLQKYEQNLPLTCCFLWWTRNIYSCRCQTNLPTTRLLSTAKTCFQPSVLICIRSTMS